VRIDLVNTNHETVDTEVVAFVIPEGLTHAGHR
jgi:hypothetical protein